MGLSEAAISAAREGSVAYTLSPPLIVLPIQFRLSLNCRDMEDLPRRCLGAGLPVEESFRLLFWVLYKRLLPYALLLCMSCIILEISV